MERGLNPLLSLLPLSLFAVAVLADLGALMSGLSAFGDIANGKPVPESAIRNIDLWTA